MPNAKQVTLASVTYDAKKVTTDREHFLNRMEKIIPWRLLEGLIEPDYPKAGNGRRPYPLGVMLRVHLLQQWYQFSDRQAQHALYENEVLRRFVGVELVEDAIPDETTILRFRHLLEEHGLTKLMFDQINCYLRDSGVGVSPGTMVDATVIDAPRSTKNRARRRDPEMGSTRKGNTFFHGMKIHIGSDMRSKQVHSVSVTSASTHDISQLSKLLRADDKAILGDSGYAARSYKVGARQENIFWGVCDKRLPRKSKSQPLRELSASQKKRNCKIGRARIRVEHVFRVIKCQFGYRKTRYRGIAKNQSQVFMLCGLANLYMFRAQLAG